jgi:type II secretory pathway pseudopilin PulG
MDRKKQRVAMTLVEVLMVVSIIGLLSACLVPLVNMATQYRQNSEVAHQLRTAIQAFEMYRAETGGYPPDKTPAVTPPEMVEYFDYFDIDWWSEVTAVGGNWDWDQDNNFTHAIAIAGPRGKLKQIVNLDKMTDDGDLSTGKFRLMTGRYQYILEE